MLNKSLNEKLNDVYNKHLDSYKSGGFVGMVKSGRLLSKKPMTYNEWLKSYDANQIIKKHNNHSYSNKNSEVLGKRFLK